MYVCVQQYIINKEVRVMIVRFSIRNHNMIKAISPSQLSPVTRKSPRARRNTALGT